MQHHWLDAAEQQTLREEELGAFRGDLVILFDEDDFVFAALPKSAVKKAMEWFLDQAYMAGNPLLADFSVSDPSIYDFESSLGFADGVFLLLADRNRIDAAGPLAVIEIAQIHLPDASRRLYIHDTHFGCLRQCSFRQCSAAR